jgi:hypothetical protein
MRIACATSLLMAPVGATTGSEPVGATDGLETKAVRRCDGNPLMVHWPGSARPLGCRASVWAACAPAASADPAGTGANLETMKNVRHDLAGMVPPTFRLAA